MEQSDLGTSPAGPRTRLRLEWGWNHCLSSQSLVPTPRNTLPGTQRPWIQLGPRQSLFFSQTLGRWCPKW